MFVSLGLSSVRLASIVLITSSLMACGGGSSDVVINGEDTDSSGASDSGSTDAGGDTDGADSGSTDAGGSTDGADSGSTDAGGSTDGADSGGTDTGGGTGGTDGDGEGGDSGNGDGDGGTDENETAADLNFLLIITDDQGIDASAQYSFSSDLPNTPNIDQLASNGIVFDNMWATSSCTTTRGSLLTGLHGVNSGVDTTPSLLDTDILTVQKHLGDNAGYQTAVFGKWHVSGGGSGNILHPNETGVDHYAGNITGVLDDYSNWPLVINGVEQTSTTYHTTAITDMAIDWIQQQDDPWFTWIAYVAPHSPYHLPPAELHNRSLSGTNQDINNNTRSYFLAAIEAMDTEIGRLLDSMSAEQRENTVVMVLGDNGSPPAVLDTDAFPRSHGKSTLYEGGIRVPFLVSGEPVTRGNVREAALVNTVDLFPTLSDAANISLPPAIDGVSFWSTLSDSAGSDRALRELNYSEFIGENTNGWAVRDAEFKLITFADGSREFYDMLNDVREETNLVDEFEYAERIAQFEAYAANVRSGNFGATPDNGSSDVIDISDAILNNANANCAAYAANYESRVLDVNNNTSFNGSLQIQVANDRCIFSTNAIPNHDFNDGADSFPSDVAEQNDQYVVTRTPVAAFVTTPLSLTMDNAVLLNGVKVDILAAACFGVGDERTGCTDPEQPWRFDPMFSANGFRVDSHNAHTQPNGAYHYHGNPNALFDDDSSAISPLVGFAADGFPIFGSYFDDGSGIRKARSSFRLKAGSRPDGNGNPGGTHDGTYRDDYEYVDGLGDLDECNGMTVNGSYGYYMVDEFPYVLSCFRGTPDASFFK